MKVLFVEPPPPRRVGGIETALRGLAEALPAVGVVVTRTSDVTVAMIREAGVVHFHGLWEYRHHRARGWCASAGKPFLVSPHGMLEDWAFRHRGWKKRPYFRLFERPSVARADVILATSRLETEPLLRSFPPEKIRVLPLGAHPPAQLAPHAAARAKLGYSDNEYVVLFLSRCHAKKGLHLLVDALPQLAPRDGRRVRLVVVGDGEPAYVEPLRRKAATWREPFACSWEGPRWGIEKWDYLGAADLFCLPTFSENFGLAVLEALFAGTPALTTHATPWPALRGTLPVYLTTPSVPELLQALQLRLDTAALTEAERAACRHEAQRTFNWSTLAPRYAELYDELAARR